MHGNNLAARSNTHELERDGDDIIIGDEDSNIDMDGHGFHDRGEDDNEANDRRNNGEIRHDSDPERDHSHGDASGDEDISEDENDSEEDRSSPDSSEKERLDALKMLLHEVATESGFSQYEELAFMNAWYSPA
jgi:hypothetical protein